MSWLSTRLPKIPPATVSNVQFWRAVVSMFNNALTRYPKAPSDSASPGQQGDVYLDEDYLYYHDGTQWKRVSGSVF